MTDEPDPSAAPIRAQGDIAKERGCLRCGGRFWSEGFGQRICTRCKSSITWRTAMPAMGRRNGRGPSGGAR